jgi:hypothetical protein
MEARQSLNAAYKSLGDALMKAGNKNAETSTK